MFSNFVVNKITAVVGCVHMLICNACAWGRLHALWSYNELSSTNCTVLVNMAILSKSMHNYVAGHFIP